MGSNQQAEIYFQRVYSAIEGLDVGLPSRVKKIKSQLINLFVEWNQVRHTSHTNEEPPTAGIEIVPNEELSESDLATGNRPESVANEENLTESNVELENMADNSNEAKHIESSVLLGNKKKTGRGKGSKGFGKGGAKRHRKVLRDNIQGISKPAVRRLARRGGVTRISGLIYEEARGALKSFLDRAIRAAITYTENSNRKTVTVMDVTFALKREGCTFYGLES